MREIARGEAWIIDGNYRSWALDARLERADTVIFLDFSRTTCLLRALRRWIKYYGQTRPDLGEGCPEKIDMWLVKWIWGYPKRARGKTLEWLAGIGPPKQVVHLRGNRAVRVFLRSL